MQYKNTLEAIYIQLNEVQQNVASWGEDKNVRNIDVDLALDKLRDAYDLLISLKGESNFLTPTSEKKNAENIENKQEIIEKITDRTPEISIPKRNEETIEEKKEKTKEIIIEELTKISKIPSTSDQKSNLSDKFGHNRPTLNEELSSHVESKDLANRLKNRPITNLSSAIGLNEKFEFINSLFHGDKEKYEETIEKLNQATNFNEAYNFISAELKWDMSKPSIQRILDLIRRKLIVKDNGK